MAFTGFNFRQTAGGGTGFTSDPVGTTGVVSSPSAVIYPSSLTLSGGGTVTAGYKTSSAAGSNTNNTADMRLAGLHSITGTNVIFQVDVPNGQYDIRIGAGAAGSAAQQNARIYYGSGPNDFTDVTSGVINGSGTATTVPNGSEMDGSGAILTDANWASQYSNATTTVGTTRVAVKNGFLQISRSAGGNLQLRHFSYQLVPGTLQAVTLDTDDTGVVINTTGTTTAGSAAVTAIPNITGIAPNMTVSGPAIPTGTTVASVGAPGTNSAITSLTLSSGTNVTAATAGNLKFYYLPQLYEKEAIGKLVAPITYLSGSANFSVLTADKSGSHPYLDVKTADPNGSGYPQPFLYIKAAGFPGTASTHTFVIRQTDTSGNYTGSPFDTTLTLPVVFAPTKPTTGFYSKVSSGAWVMREAIRTKFLDGRWLGYKGQSLYQPSVKVTNFSDFVTQATTFAASAGANRWFQITLSGEVGSNWLTSYSNTGTSWNFRPDLGGGLIVTNDAISPVIYGNLYTGNQRGIEYRGLIWPGNQSPGNIPQNGATAAWRVDGSGTNLSVVIFRNCKFGMLYDPTMTDAALANGISGTGEAGYGGLLGVSGTTSIVSINGSDQISTINCDFWGSADAIRLTDVRIFESAWNRFRRIYGDCHAIAGTRVSTPVSFTIPLTNASVADQEVVSYVHDGVSWLCIDNPQTGNSDLSDVIHPDYYQVRNAASGVAQNTTALLLENNISHSNAINYNTDANGKHYSYARQFLQGGNDQNTTPIRSVILNNFGASFQSRGADLFGVYDGYTEYNTFVTQAVLPASGTNPYTETTPSILADFVSTKRLPGRKRTRKNIATTIAASVSACLFSEDNQFIRWDTIAPLPDTVFTPGLFVKDSDPNFNRLGYSFPLDVVGTLPNDIRKATWSVFKPRVDAGTQEIRGRIGVGESDTLTNTQSATLVASTESQPTGTLAGPTQLRWNDTSGSAVGVDVTLIVQ